MKLDFKILIFVHPKLSLQFSMSFFSQRWELILDSCHCFQVMNISSRVFCFDLICVYFWNFGGLMFSFPVSYWKVFKISVNCLTFVGMYDLTREILLFFCPYFTLSFPLKLFCFHYWRNGNLIIFGYQFIMYSTSSVVRVRLGLLVSVSSNVNWTKKVIRKVGSDLCINMFTTVLFIIENNWKPPVYLFLKVIFTDFKKCL